MRQTVLSALMTALLLLAACGAPAEMDEFDAFRQTLEPAEEITFTAELTAEADGAEFSCTAAFRGSGEAAELTLLAPALIEGVSARVTPEGAALVYGGATLELGELTGSAATPLTALPALVDALHAGHAVRAWREQTGDAALLAVSLLRGEDETYTVWFGPETTPVYAELSVDGRTVLRCTLTDWAAA